MARSRASPTRSSRASAPPHAPPAAPAKPPSSTQQTHKQEQPQVTNIYVQRGGAGGGGGGMLGTMAAVAGGSVIGHGISNYLYGGSNQAPTQPAEAQQLAQAAAQENNACAPQLGGYAKCMESNPDNTESCKWAWDYFLQCRDSNASKPPA